MDFGLGLSYDPEKNLTYGMLLGCNRKQTAFIAGQLRQLGSLAAHPLVMPTMILGYNRSFLREQVRWTRTKMFEVETTSGQTWWPIIGTEDRIGLFEREPQKVDTRQLSKAALGVIQSTTIYQRHLENLVVLVDAVNAANESLPTMNVDKCTGSSSQMIHERLQFIRIKTELSLPAIRSSKERSQAQIGAVSDSHLMLN
jgi:hypothetical protein